MVGPPGLYSQRPPSWGWNLPTGPSQAWHACHHPAWSTDSHFQGDCSGLCLGMTASYGRFAPSPCQTRAILYLWAQVFATFSRLGLLHSLLSGMPCLSLSYLGSQVPSMQPMISLPDHSGRPRRAMRQSATLVYKCMVMSWSSGAKLTRRLPGFMLLRRLGGLFL